MSLSDPDEKIVPNRLKPKDAATLILVKREHSAARVLMGRRHANMVFQPNKYVFPGGRIDPGDQRIALPSDLKPDVLAKLSNGTTP